MTVREKTTDTTQETGITEDATSGKESYVKTLYTMHLCENIHCKICKHLTDILQISIKISFLHTNIYIYIDICIHVIYIHLMSEKNTK